MAKNDSLDGRINRFINKYPTATGVCMVAIMIAWVIGVYKFMSYLSSIYPSVKTLGIILGIPVSIGVGFLILYILWKIYKGVSWLMDEWASNIKCPWRSKGPLDY